MMKRVVLAIAVLGVVASACVRIPPVRVLPQSITSLYIVTFSNLTYEPGLEEKLTRFTQEEFMVDGRLDVTRRVSADAILAGKIRTFDVLPNRLGVDDFPLTSRIAAVADVALYDPLDRKREKPLMTWEGIDAQYMFVSDTRRVIEMIPDDAYEVVLRNLAREIVLTVLTRQPTERAANLVTGPAPASTAPQRVLGRQQLDTRFLDATSSESVSIKEPVGPQPQPEP